ncbi:conserved protein [Tepidicaulis marinus]|uniref:Conserved protein n=1 Tax=Tepidicaulis marinus TaxID=1333998 RepID=A0A081BDB4_9HYPH|nr:GDYXXLXY domain-containing protein [Tepidicaulis marinus]GAK46032.1 conserved protein [Tepidicaulis marinus]
MSFIDKQIKGLQSPAPRARGTFALAVAAIFLAQALFLGAMIWDRMALLRSGTEVTLAIEPVDPRDLFRGDYVVLTYDISRLEESKLAGDNGFEEGDEVWVTLEEQDGLWQAAALYRAAPDDGIFIKGRVDYAIGARPRTVEEEEPCENCRMLTLFYGIESYFVPEGTGWDLEEQRNENRLAARIALGSDGEAAIKGLLLDGELIYEEPLF